MYEFTPFIPEGTSSKLMGYQLPLGTRSRIPGVNLERPSSFSYLRLGDAITRDVQSMTKVKTGVKGNESEKHVGRCSSMYD